MHSKRVHTDFWDLINDIVKYSVKSTWFLLFLARSEQTVEPVHVSRYGIVKFSHVTGGGGHAVTAVEKCLV